MKRTNSSPEHKFASRKRGWRRQSGNEKLKKRLEACNVAEFLVDNLKNDTYVQIVYDGSLNNMAQRFAEHWSDIAQPNERDDQNTKLESLDSRTGRRLRVTKKILRSPDFFKMMSSAIRSLDK